MSEQEYLKLAAERGLAYRQNIDAQCPYPRANTEELRALFDTGLPDNRRPGAEVLTQLADAAEAGLVASSGDAFYGWVMGATDPVGMAADWLTSAWGQNSAIYQTAPSAAIAEEVSAKWLIDLLGLPPGASTAFTTGATMGSFICLAAARTHLLEQAGWNLEQEGQFGAPEVTVFVSEEAHQSIFSALRLLGFGANKLVKISADGVGRMLADDLKTKMSNQTGPAIIIAQAGHINTAAFDNFHAINAIARTKGAWVHIDGAFGLWANASPTTAHLCDGAELADSWAVDGHKWFQIPYDSGFAFVRHAAAHRRAMTMSAGYLNETAADGRNPTHYVPELSRRAHGFTVWAVLQSLGRAGVREIVQGNSANAARLAAILENSPGVRILHTVALNQISLVFEDPDTGASRTQDVVNALQSDGRWFVKEAEWGGETIMRLSFSSATKTDAEIDEFGAAILTCWAKS
jgi:glutamate/tyrosine decarboxylase-like PLP-dependent enzyme